MVAQTEWRTLAAPTYAVSRWGRAEQLPAGTVIRQVLPEGASIIEDQVRGTIRVVVASGALECETSPVVLADSTYGRTRPHPALWWVTASALRFEGEDEADPCPICGGEHDRISREDWDGCGMQCGPCPPLSCSGCGAEVYTDGTHVLDRHDRASTGYPACPTERGA